MPPWPIAHHQHDAMGGAQIAATIHNVNIAGSLRCRMCNKRVGLRSLLGNEIPKHITIRIECIVIAQTKIR